MSLITLCIVLFCIQPLIIYKVMFSEKEKRKDEIEFPLSFLVIAPSFSYFYVDTFGYALLLLGSVSILGCVLAKLCEKKARNSLQLEDLFVFLIAWFIIFSVGYGIGVLWDYVSSFWETPTTPVISEITNNEIPGNIHVPVEALSTAPLLSNMVPSLIYLGVMASLLLLKFYEVYSSTKKCLTGNPLMILSIFPGVFALFSEYYILSLIFNVFIYLQVATIIIEYEKRTDKSAGSIWFILMFVLMGGVCASSIYKLIVWFFSY